MHRFDHCGNEVYARPRYSNKPTTDSQWLNTRRFISHSDFSLMKRLMHVGMLVFIWQLHHPESVWPPWVLWSRKRELESVWVVPEEASATFSQALARP